VSQYSTEGRKIGDEAVGGYQAHAETPYGMLRHDLLFHYYDTFISKRKIDLFFDIGGGAGLLSKALLSKHPDLRVWLLDDDDKMIEQARGNLAEHLDNPNLTLGVANAQSFPKVLADSRKNGECALIAFNHVIEYIEDKDAVLEGLAGCVPKGSYFSIMYLNNSSEAFRKVFFKDNIAGVHEQLRTGVLNMTHFGLAKALDSEHCDRLLGGCGLTPLEQYAMRCVADYKSKEFVGGNYAELLELEKHLGTLRDFWGIARYRVKFFGREAS
jgi:hypothetical protein